jgi:hypothetical protein
MVVGEDRILKTGTGVTIDDRGVVLTAGHVLCDDSGELLNGRVIVDTDDGQVEHEPMFSGDLGFEHGHKGISGDINIDLNVLLPPEGLSEQNYLPLHEPVCQVGEDVILAGYPDEITLEFDPEDMVDYDAFGGDPRSRLQREVFSELFKPEMLKRGMVGNVQHVVLNNINLRPIGVNKMVTIEGAYYAIDTHLTTGGSGGAVVNRDGELMGIVIRRSKTELDNRLLRLIPAGTGVAVSHHLMTWALDIVE